MLLDRFVEHLAYEKRYSSHTVSAYRRDLEQFQLFLTSFGGGELHRATDRAVRRWMMQLMEQGTGPRSVHRKLSALRGFYRFARLVGDASHDPTALLDPPRTPKRLPEFVDENDDGQDEDERDHVEPGRVQRLQHVASGFAAFHRRAEARRGRNGY